jgi:hypothetical protein
MAMTIQELHDAATQIDAKAATCHRRASAVRDQNLAALHGGVARQLQDRAGQIRIWAWQAERAGEVTPEMEVGTREFLQLAGRER